MTSVPPPPPATGSFQTSASGSNALTKSSGKASIFPLIFALLCMIFSIVIWIIYRGQAVSIWLYILGYALTPFSVVIMMGWDTITQRKQMSRDPWFVPRPKYSRMLRLLTAVSFLVAFPHIWQLAQILADYLPEPIVNFLGNLS